MPSDFVVQALEYGVLGFSAISLVGAWGVLLREQKREGEPRQGIVAFTKLFMGFCLILVLLNTAVQVWGSGPEASEVARIAALEDSLQVERERLASIRAAADPLLNVRGDVIGSLPESLPQKPVLEHLLRELRRVLQ